MKQFFSTFLATFLAHVCFALLALVLILVYFGHILQKTNSPTETPVAETSSQPEKSCDDVTNKCSTSYFARPLNKKMMFVRKNDDKEDCEFVIVNMEFLTVGTPDPVFVKPKGADGKEFDVLGGTNTFAGIVAFTDPKSAFDFIVMSGLSNSALAEVTIRSYKHNGSSVDGMFDISNFVTSKKDIYKMCGWK